VALSPSESEEGSESDAWNTTSSLRFFASADRRVVGECTLVGGGARTDSMTTSGIQVPGISMQDASQKKMPCMGVVGGHCEEKSHGFGVGTSREMNAAW
jgi:hypothetical protein